MASRAQLRAIAEWDAWRRGPYAWRRWAKPPRSEAELGISEQEIAAGWAQYLEEKDALIEECLRLRSLAVSPLPTTTEVAPAPRATEPPTACAWEPRPGRRSCRSARWLLALALALGCLLGGALAAGAEPKPLQDLSDGTAACPAQLDFGENAPEATLIAPPLATQLGCTMPMARIAAATSCSPIT